MKLRYFANLFSMPEQIMTLLTKRNQPKRRPSYLLILQPCQLTIPREGTEHDNGDTVEERISCEGPPVQQENL